MYPEIQTWLRAYFAVRERAADARGLDEVHAGTPERRSWPRTTGGDVRAITAALDPIVRSRPLRFGGHGLGRRWRACVDDVARDALPDREYPHNESFWSAFSAMCVYLHSTKAPIAPALLPGTRVLAERSRTQPRSSA